MLCDICKKNEAVIHIQEISAAGKKIINLCNECAEKHPHGVDSMLNLDNLKFEDVLEKIQKISAEFIKSKSTVANSSVFIPRTASLASSSVYTFIKPSKVLVDPVA